MIRVMTSAESLTALLGRNGMDRDLPAGVFENDTTAARSIFTT
jgi:hypothetical protein